MERKSFQVVMQPTAHRRAKLRAGQLGITIGQYMENLISAMELRLNRAYKQGKAMNVAGMIDDLFLKVLFEADEEGWIKIKLIKNYSIRRYTLKRKTWLSSQL